MQAGLNPFSSISRKPPLLPEVSLKRAATLEQPAQDTFIFTKPASIQQLESEFPGKALGLTFSKAQLQDVEEISRHIWRVSGQKEEDEDRIAWKRQYRQTVQDRSHYCYVIKEPTGRLVGTGAVTLYDEEGGTKPIPAAKITNVYIRPDYQGRKLGQWVMKCLVQRAKTALSEQIWLKTRNPIAQSLYEKMGFQPQWREGSGVTLCLPVNSGV